MSAFLGPIHHWLFGKIQAQDNLTNTIVARFGGDELAGALSAKYGELEREPLEAVIDGGNIHGWLQQRVSLVEARFAAAVTALLTRGLAELSDLERLAFEFGRESRATAISSPEEGFAYLNNLLLDGMPCDHVNAVVTQTEDEVIWQRTKCIHRDYWDAVGGEAGNYYTLRDAWIAGALEHTGLCYEKLEEGQYRLGRCSA